MKILVVRITGKISGAELYSFILLKEFEKFKNISLSFISNLPAFTDKINALGGYGITIPVPVQEIGTKKHFLKALFIFPYYLWIYLNAIRSLENDKRFDLICFESMTEKLFLTLLLTLLKYKIVWIEHGPLYSSERARVIKILYRVMSMYADKIIAVSTDTENDLTNGHVSTKKIFVIHPWIEIRQYTPLSLREQEKIKMSLDINKNDSIVGFSSGVNEAKGIREFISVADKILKRTQNIAFIIIGDGELKSWAKEEISRLRISGKFYFVDLKEIIRDYVGIVNVLFFPSKHREGTPAALLQAMCMEKVILAHNVGGVSEIIINGKTGFTYDTEKENWLANKVIALCDTKYSHIGKNAREFILKNFDNSLITDKMYKVFISLLRY